MDNQDLLYNTCPHCGARIDQSPTWPFWEMWNNEWHRQMDCCGFHADKPQLGESFGISYDIEDGFKKSVKPKPLSLIAWEQKNPEPKMRLGEYVLKLAQRLEKLEAALANKEQIRFSVK